MRFLLPDAWVPHPITYERKGTLPIARGLMGSVAIMQIQGTLLKSTADPPIRLG